MRTIQMTKHFVMTSLLALLMPVVLFAPQAYAETYVAGQFGATFPGNGLSDGDVITTRTPFPTGTFNIPSGTTVSDQSLKTSFMLGGKIFEFRLKHKFPRELSKEFLFVDLLNNLNELAEDRDNLLKSVKEKVLAEPQPQMKRAFNAYGGERTKSLFNKWMTEGVLVHA